MAAEEQGGLRRSDLGVLARAWPLWFVVVLAAVVAAAIAPNVTGDWGLFLATSRSLTGESGAFVYADHPNIQTGPVSLLVVRVVGLLGDAVLAPLFAAVGVATVALVARARPTSTDRDVGLLVGGVVLMLWWPYLKTFGHLDDAMVLAIASLALVLVLRDRRVPAALLVGLALAVKPWAIFLVPLTFDRSDWRRRRLPAPLISVVVGAALWAPVLVRSFGALKGLRPTVVLAADSVLRLFGVGEGDLSGAVRGLQLALAFGASMVAVVRRRPGGVLLVGVAVRLAMDAGTWNYYTIGFILGALTWDLVHSPARLPWTTLLACVLLPPDFVVHAPGLRAILRLIACAGAVAIVLWPSRRPPPASAEAARSQPAMAG